jgi:hypothetical protein
MPRLRGVQRLQLWRLRQLRHLLHLLGSVQLVLEPAVSAAAGKTKQSTWPG